MLTIIYITFANKLLKIIRKYVYNLLDAVRCG